MMPATEAEALILQLVQPLDPLQDREQVPLPQALGRVLAAEISSHLDFPHWDNSAMDGYAVRCQDVQGATTEAPVVLTLIEEIPAGQVPQQTVHPGQAARLFTGSMLPAGADTVVMQEHTQAQSGRVHILQAPQPQAFVRQRGSYYRAGDPLLPAGGVLGGADIAVLAAAQCAQVPVYRRPRVALLSTGSELVSLETPLGPGQIVDSNQYALAALVSQAGGEPLCLGIVPDDPPQLRAAIASALTQADLVLSSGGVSGGDYDHVDTILKDLGGTLPIRAVAVKPGKPLTVATLAHTPSLYIGLPGNPVSALVCFWRFVAPALRKLSGQARGWSPAFVPATNEQPLRAGGQRETYLWGQLRAGQDGYSFRLAAGSHSSGNLINLAQTNGLAVVPIGQRQIAAAAIVRVLPLGGA
ncbi:molybdopterin molybdotransferase MoeA [Halomicronema hongdechloris]